MNHQKPKKTNISIVSRLLEIADQRLLVSTGHRLDPLETIVLKGTLESKTYPALAIATHHSSKTLKDVGAQLWKKLSIALDQPVKKSNVKARLEACQAAFASQPLEIMIVPHQPAHRQDWADAPENSAFFGREEELSQLRQWILQDRAQLVTIVGLKGIGKTGLTIRLGMGGIGKTELSLKLAQGLQTEFDYVIWRSLLNAPSLDTILHDILLFLSNQQETQSAESLEKTLETVLKYFQKNRCLLILDNVESILIGQTPKSAEFSAGEYRSGYENYGLFFHRVGELPHQSCLLLTSREQPKTLQALAKHQPNKVRLFQLHGLKKQAARHLFGHSFTPLDKEKAKEKALDQVIQFYEGNPLALTLVLKRIQNLFGGDIVEFLAQDNPFFADISDLLNWHFNRLNPAEQEVLYWLAVTREPTPIETLRTDCLTPNLKEKIPHTLASLQCRLPINQSASGFSLQPVVMEYLTEKLIKLIAHEIQSQQIHWFNQICLQKGTAKDYIREAQRCLILKPLTHRLCQMVERPAALVSHLNQVLACVKETTVLRTGYSSGNLLSIFRTLETDLTGYDFSHLTLRQAYLQGMTLKQVNFSHADLSTAVFTQSFGGVYAIAFHQTGDYLAIGDSKGDIRLLRSTDYQLIRLLSDERSNLWITALAFVAGRDWLVSSSFDKTVRLWDVQTGTCLRVFTGHTQWIWGLALSPDSDLIASCGDDCTIRLWDIATGQCVRVLTDHSNWVWAVAFSPDGKTLASASYDCTVRLWTVETGKCKQVLRDHENSIWSLAFSPDGNTLASGGLDHTIRLWDMTTHICTQTLRGRTKEIRTLAFSPDGKTLVSGGFDGTLKRWEVETGRCVFTYLGHQVGVRAVAISPDGQTLVSGDRQGLRIWDLPRGHCLRSLTGYTNWVWALTIFPATLSQSPTSQRPTPQSPTSQNPTSQAQTVLTGGLDGIIRLWNIQTGTCLQTIEAHNNWVWQIACSPDGKTIATCSDDVTIKLWDSTSGSRMGALQMTLRGHTDGGIWTLDFSPDSQQLISGGQDGTLRIWSRATAQRLKVIEAHDHWIWAVLFDPTGSQFVSGSDDGSIKLWESETYKLKHVWQSQRGVRTLAWLSDRIPSQKESLRLASGHADGSIKLWCIPPETNIPETATLATATLKLDTTDQPITAPIKTFEGHQGWILSLKFHPQNNTLISCAQDSQVKVWDIETGDCLATMTGHQDWVTSMDVFSELEILVTGSADETLKIWDLRSYQCLQTIKLPLPYEGMDVRHAVGLTASRRQNLLALGAIA
ncbi:MAG: NB-ARC domain-containing protein [Cyanobacteria bacterium J06607_10]